MNCKLKTYIANNG